MLFDSVGEMLRVTDKRAFALTYSQQSHADKIIQRHRHNHQRHKNRIPLSALRLIVVGGSQAQHRHEEADDERACVSHKYFRRRKIKYQKAEQSPYEHKRQAADKDLSVQCGGGKKNRACDKGDTRRESIHVVEKIERIDYQNYPEGREQGGNYFVLDEEFDTDVSEKSGDDCDDELYAEFAERAEMLFVIPQAKGKKNEDKKQYNHKPADFAQKAGRVDGNGLAEPVKVTRDGEKFYDRRGSKDDDCKVGKDGDAASEWDSPFGKSVTCRF